MLSKTLKNQMEAKTEELKAQKDEIMKDRLIALFDDIGNDDMNFSKFKEVIADSAAAWEEIEEDLILNDPENWNKEVVGSSEKIPSDDDEFLEVNDDDEKAEMAKPAPPSAPIVASEMDDDVPLPPPPPVRADSDDNIDNV